jgi:nucleotide-binding universal stress UspA family protein
MSPKEVYMRKKILVALDDSKGAWKAVEYVAQTFNKTQGVKVTLFHVLPGLPTDLWDAGGILTEGEEKARRRLAAKWEKGKKNEMEGLFGKAQKRLVAAGVPATVLTREFRPDYSNVAQEIIDEARKGGYSTVVMGRRGLGPIKSTLLGSVTNNVVHHAQGFAVTIVE